MIRWNVYIENFNRRCIEAADLFAGEHSYLRDVCRKALKKYKDDKEQFAEEVRRSLKYQYWGRCEYEIILTSWPPDNSGRFKDEKIDVYDQVLMNWFPFIEYIWSHRKEL